MTPPSCDRHKNLQMVPFSLEYPGGTLSGHECPVPGCGRQHKAAVKVHTLLDLHGNIPSFIRITDIHEILSKTYAPLSFAVREYIMEAETLDW